MIEIYNELQEENSCRKLIKSIDGKNPQYIYFECKENEYLDNEIEQFKKLHTDRIMSELSNKRDCEYEFCTVEYEGMTTRIRDKDCSVVAMGTIVGGTYIFEEGSLELFADSYKKMLADMTNKRTEIIKRKKELEEKIKTLDLYDLSRFNSYCEW